MLQHQQYTSSSTRRHNNSIAAGITFGQYSPMVHAAVNSPLPRRCTDIIAPGFPAYYPDSLNCTPPSALQLSPAYKRSRPIAATPAFLSFRSSPKHHVNDTAHISDVVVSSSPPHDSDMSSWPFGNAPVDNMISTTTAEFLDLLKARQQEPLTSAAAAEMSRPPSQDPPHHQRNTQERSSQFSHQDDTDFNCCYSHPLFQGDPHSNTTANTLMDLLTSSSSSDDYFWETSGVGSFGSSSTTSFSDIYTSQQYSPGEQLNNHQKNKLSLSATSLRSTQASVGGGVPSHLSSGFSPSIRRAFSQQDNSHNKTTFSPSPTSSTFGGLSMSSLDLFRAKESSPVDIDKQCLETASEINRSRTAAVELLRHQYDFGLCSIQNNREATSSSDLLSIPAAAKEYLTEQVSQTNFPRRPLFSNVRNDTRQSRYSSSNWRPYASPSQSGISAHCSNGPATREQQFPVPLVLVQPAEFKNPSSFLKVYGDPLCSSGPATTCGGELVAGGRNGNWNCWQCRNVNYPRRFRCNKCNELRDCVGDEIVSQYVDLVYQQHLKTYRSLNRKNSAGNRNKNCTMSLPAVPNTF